MAADGFHASECGVVECQGEVERLGDRLICDIVVAVEYANQRLPW